MVSVSSNLYPLLCSFFFFSTCPPWITLSIFTIFSIMFWEYVTLFLPLLLKQSYWLIPYVFGPSEPQTVWKEHFYLPEQELFPPFIIDKWNWCSTRHSQLTFPEDLPSPIPANHLPCPDYFIPKIFTIFSWYSRHQCLRFLFLSTTRVFYNLYLITFLTSFPDPLQTQSKIQNEFISSFWFY